MKEMVEDESKQVRSSESGKIEDFGDHNDEEVQEKATDPSSRQFSKIMT